MQPPAAQPTPQGSGPSQPSSMEMRRRLAEMHHRAWISERGGEFGTPSWEDPPPPKTWRDRFKKKAGEAVIRNKIRKVREKMAKASERLYSITNKMSGSVDFHGATGVDYMSMYPDAGVARAAGPTIGTATVSANSPLPAPGTARAAANRPLSLNEALPGRVFQQDSMGNWPGMGMRPPMAQPPPRQPPPRQPPPPISGGGYSIPTPWQR